MNQALPLSKAVCMHYILTAKEVSSDCGINIFIGQVVFQKMLWSIVVDECVVSKGRET